MAETSGDIKIGVEAVLTNMKGLTSLMQKEVAKSLQGGLIEGGNRIAGIFQNINKGKLELITPDDFRFLNDYGNKLKGLAKQGRLVKVFEGGGAGLKDVAEGIKQVSGGFKKVGNEAAVAREVINSFAGRVGFTTTRLASYLLPASLFFQASRGAREFFSTIVDGNADIIRLSQILDTSNQNARALADQALNIGKSFGVARKEILSTTVLLAQAGPKFATPIDIQAAQDVLAKSQLGATFGNLGETASGAIAFLSQFNKEGRDLASVLDVANQLSKKFAVESKDLFEAVERGGAAFSAVGGSIEEFQALVSGVSQLTRLSASTIGTSFNTIALRVFRPEVLDFIESIGISTKDSQGNIKDFISLLRGVANEFTELDKRSKARVVDVLFGVRQGKIGVKLLEDLGLGSGKSIIESSLGETEKAQGSIERDAVKGLQRIDVQLKQLGVSFQEAFLAIGEDPAFQKFLKDSIDLIGILASTLKTVAPLLAPLIKFGAIFTAVRTFQLAPDVIRSLRQTGRTAGGIGAVSRAAAGEDLPDGIGSEIASVGQMVSTGRFSRTEAELAQMGVRGPTIFQKFFSNVNKIINDGSSKLQNSLSQNETKLKELYLRRLNLEQRVLASSGGRTQLFSTTRTQIQKTKSGLESSLDNTIKELADAAQDVVSPNVFIDALKKNLAPGAFRTLGISSAAKEAARRQVESQFLVNFDVIEKETAKQLKSIQSGKLKQVNPSIFRQALSGKALVEFERIFQNFQSREAQADIAPNLFGRKGNRRILQEDISELVRGLSPFQQRDLASVSARQNVFPNHGVGLAQRELRRITRNISRGEFGDIKPEFFNQTLDRQGILSRVIGGGDDSGLSKKINNLSKSVTVQEQRLLDLNNTYADRNLSEKKSAQLARVASRLMGRLDRSYAELARTVDQQKKELRSQLSLMNRAKVGLREFSQGVGAGFGRLGEIARPAGRIAGPLAIPALADLVSSRVFRREELDFSQGIPDNESLLTSLRGNRGSAIGQGALSGASSGLSIALLSGAGFGVGALVTVIGALANGALSASQATEEMNQQLNAAAASAKNFTDFMRILGLLLDNKGISNVSSPDQQFDQQNIFLKVIRSALATATTLNLTEGFRGADFEDPSIRRQFNQQFDQGGLSGIVFNVEAFLTGIDKVRTVLEQMPIQARIRIENELRKNLQGSVKKLSDADLKDLSPNEAGELSPEGLRKLDFFAKIVKDQMINTLISQGRTPEQAKSIVAQFTESNRAIKEQIESQDRLKRALRDATSSIPAFLIGLEEIAERQKLIFAQVEAGRFSRTSSLGAAVSPLSPQLIGPEFMQLFSTQLRESVRGRGQLPASANNFLSGFQQDDDLATISGLSSEFIKPMADQLSRIANSALAGTEGSNISEIKALAETLDKREDPLAKQLSSVFQGLLGQNLEKFKGKTPNQIFEELIKSIDPSDAIVNIIGGNLESLNRDIQEFGQLMDATTAVWNRFLDIAVKESDVRLSNISRQAGIGFINSQQTLALLDQERTRVGTPRLGETTMAVTDAMKLVDQRTRERNKALFPTAAGGPNDIADATKKLALAQLDLRNAQYEQSVAIARATQQEKILIDTLAILNRNFNDFVQSRTSLAQTPIGDVRQAQSLNKFVLGGTDLGKVIGQVGSVSELKTVFEQQPELFNKALQQAGFNRGLVERFIKSTSAFGQTPINDKSLPSATAGTIAAILATINEGPTGRDPKQIQQFFEMIENQNKASRSIEQINAELIEVQKKVNQVEQDLLDELLRLNTFLGKEGQASLSIAATALATKLEELKGALDRSGQKASMKELSDAMSELTKAFTGSLKVDHAVIIKGLESLPVDDPIVQPIVLALITSLIDHLGVDSSSQKLREALMKVKNEIATRSGK